MLLTLSKARSLVRLVPRCIKPHNGVRFLGLSGAAALLNGRRVVVCESKPVALDRPPEATIGVLVKDKKNGRSHAALLASMLTRTDWLLLLLSAICSTAASLLTTAQARFIGRIFDSLGSAQNLQAGLGRLLSLFLGQALLSFTSSTALSVATTNLGVRLRVGFFRAMLLKDMAELDTQKTGEIAHQLSQDVASLQTAVRESFTRGVESVTSLVSGSFLLYSISPAMSGYLLAMLPIGALAGTFLGESLRTLSKRARESANRATGIASESLANLRTVRAFAAEDKEVEKYESQLENGSTLKTQMALFSGAFYAAIGLGINVTTLMICGWGHQLIEQGLLTKGDIATIATQVQLLERSLARLSVLSASLSKAMKGSEHIFEAILSEPSITRPLRPSDISRTALKGSVELCSVDFSYPTRKDAIALDNVSLKAHQNEVIALVGASGAGKSTVFQLIERFYDPDSGAVLLDGIDIRSFDPRELRRIIGYVPQKPDLFSGTVADNIRYGMPNATIKEIQTAAKRANAHDFIMGFPNGYDEMLGEAGTNLSGGQRQRIAIARSLLLDPKVLLLDEITSGLDSESEFLVSQALAELMKDRTTFIIAHRLNTVRNASRVYVIEDGKVVEVGTHDELLKMGGAYKSFWDKQMRDLKRSPSQK